METSSVQTTQNELDHMLDLAQPSTEWSLKDFDIGRPIAKGHFGRVYLARLRREDQFILALKCLSKEEVAQKGVEAQVKREIEVMQKLRHTNIIQLLGWFHDSERIFLMLEFAGQGELYKHLCKAGRFSERRSSRYIGQVAAGLAYLHSKDIIHRDIKPENLLLGTDGQVKIGDFGWSVHSPEVDSQRTLAGTLSYVAPEMILGTMYGRAIDAWALGVLAYEFTCGQEPFAADTTHGTRLVQTRICRCDVVYPPELSEEATSLMQALLVLVPADRATPAQVNDHPWIIRHSES